MKSSKTSQPGPRLASLSASRLDRIKEYTPGKSIPEIAAAYNLDPEEIIKAGSNENPLGPSPLAVEAIKKEAWKAHLYPSDSSVQSLREALASYTGHPSENIVVGNGMDGVIDTLVRIYQGSETLIPVPTFSYYELATQTHGGRPIFYQRGSEFQVEPQGLLDAVTPKTAIVFLTSPNNPTGNTIPERDLREVLEGLEDRAIVFLDEAYVEFASGSLAHLTGEYENLVVGRTFSKVFGLAGLRIGYALLPDWLTPLYHKAATPFAVNRLAIAAAQAALSDQEHLKKTIELVKTGRKQLTWGLNLKTYTSQANFVLASTKPATAREVSEKLLQKGIIVRDCTSFRGAGENLIRITVMRPEQNQRIIEALEEINQI